MHTSRHNQNTPRGSPCFCCHFYQPPETRHAGLIYSPKLVNYVRRCGRCTALPSKCQPSSQRYKLVFRAFRCERCTGQCMTVPFRCGRWWWWGNAGVLVLMLPVITSNTNRWWAATGLWVLKRCAWPGDRAPEALNIDELRAMVRSVWCVGGARVDKQEYN